MSTAATADDDNAKFAAEREHAELDRPSLYLDHLLQKPALMGLVVGTLLSQVELLFGAAHYKQLFITTAAFTAILMMLLEVALDSPVPIVWRLSPSFTRYVLFPFLNFMVFVSVTLTTTFFVQWIQHDTQQNTLLLREWFAFFFVFTFAIFYVSYIIGRVSSLKD